MAVNHNNANNGKCGDSYTLATLKFVQIGGERPATATNPVFFNGKKYFSLFFPLISKIRVFDWFHCVSK